MRKIEGKNVHTSKQLHPMVLKSPIFIVLSVLSVMAAVLIISISAYSVYNDSRTPYSLTYCFEDIQMAPVSHITLDYNANAVAFNFARTNHVVRTATLVEWTTAPHTRHIILCGDANTLGCPTDGKTTKLTQHSGGLSWHNVISDVINAPYGWRVVLNLERMSATAPSLIEETTITLPFNSLCALGSDL